MGDSRAGRLLRSVDAVVYWAVAAPVLARLPAALGYRVACWRGDWLFRCQAGRRTELARNLRLVLGDEPRPAAAAQGFAGARRGGAVSWHVTCGWCSETSSARRRCSR